MLAELEVCRLYRIPHSLLIHGGTPEWSEMDTVLAVAYEQWLKVEAHDRCPDCSTKRSDWIDPDTGAPHETPRWVTDTVDCPACAAVEQARKALGDDPPRHRHVILRGLTDDEAAAAVTEPDVDDTAPVDDQVPVWMEHPTAGRAPTTLAEWRDTHAVNGWRVVFNPLTGDPLRVGDASPDPEG